MGGGGEGGAGLHRARARGRLRRDDGGGNVALLAQMPTLSRTTATWDIAIGFGDSHASAMAEAYPAAAQE